MKPIEVWHKYKAQMKLKTKHPNMDGLTNTLKNLNTGFAVIMKKVFYYNYSIQKVGNISARFFIQTPLSRNTFYFESKLYEDSSCTDPWLNECNDMNGKWDIWSIWWQVWIYTEWLVILYNWPQIQDIFSQRLLEMSLEVPTRLLTSDRLR